MEQDKLDKIKNDAYDNLYALYSALDEWKDAEMRDKIYELLKTLEVAYFGGYPDNYIV